VRPPDLDPALERLIVIELCEHARSIAIREELSPIQIAELLVASAATTLRSCRTAEGEAMSSDSVKRVIASCAAALEDDTQPVHKS